MPLNLASSTSIRHVASFVAQPYTLARLAFSCNSRLEGQRPCRYVCTDCAGAVETQLCGRRSEKPSQFVCTTFGLCVCAVRSCHKAHAALDCGSALQVAACSRAPTEEVELWSDPNPWDVFLCKFCLPWVCNLYFLSCLAQAVPLSKTLVSALFLSTARRTGITPDVVSMSLTCPHNTLAGSWKPLKLVARFLLVILLPCVAHVPWPATHWALHR